MLKTIDLFAGAGGLSLGFKQTEHFRLVAAAEIKAYARETYKHNIPNPGDEFVFIKNVVGYDFSSLSNHFDGIDVVIGGPPCQGFSNANRQKTNLISMNNALVKEYFRAIKEIKPRAFVMENVSMLKSNVHRFYDSHIDHDLIEQLNKTSADHNKQLIPMRTDKIIMSSRSYDGFNLKEIAENQEQLEALLIPHTLFHLLNVLSKNTNNGNRLPAYLKKHSDEICKEIDDYCANDAGTAEKEAIYRWLQAVKKALSENSRIEETPELQDIVELQKTFHTINEAYDNQLIGEYSVENSALIFTVKSYAVIDYVNAILENEYIQHGATLNAVCFGVPQERKRHIVIGVRSDCLENGNFDMLQEPKEYDTVTVEDAISDLEVYDVSLKSECTEIPYAEGQKVGKYAATMREGSTSVKNHFATATTENAKKRFEVIEKGKNFGSLPDKLKTTYSKPERTQKTIYLRLDPEKPSGTVVNVRKSMWIHPEKNRAITLREAARLQSFPDKFEFKGSKDSQYQQVGNAVPPLLAKAIAEHVYKIIGE